MSDSPDRTLTASDFLNKQDHRRGAIPTPAGALPLPRRRRKGMVDLSAWDAHVAATNQAAGTASNYQAPNVLGMVAPTAAAQAEELINQAAAPAPSSAPAAPTLPPRPQDPDADEVVELGNTPRPPTSSGALLEDSQIRGSRNPEVNIPRPSPEGIAAAKAALKAEEEAAAAPASVAAPVPADKIPPPPARKQATKQARPATQTDK